MNRHVLACLACLAVLGFAGTRAGATVVTWDLNTAFSGALSQGVPPFIRLEFDDAVVPGAVRMTGSAPGLHETEWVARLNLNLDPALDVEELFFGNFIIHSGTMLQPILHTGANSFEADAGGLFDLQLEFAVSGGGFTRRWNLGETFSFDITGGEGFNANSFNFLSQPPATAGTQLLATLIQGIGVKADEGFHTVPEPSTALLALLALGGLALRPRR